VLNILANNKLSRHIIATVPGFPVASRIIMKMDLLFILPRKIADQFTRNGLLKKVELPLHLPRFRAYQH
jgi:hypothetical protein